MKPIRLALSGFGAFVDEQIVDFTGMEDIYLITGPTGAGKTTIFDGIIYALYGEVTGTREEKFIRSNYVDDSQDTIVAFEFRIHGKKYKN